MANVPQSGTFGNRLHTLRIKKQLSRRYVADQIGLSTTTQLSHYENNDGFPTIPHLIKLAAVLDADIHWLLTGECAPTTQINIQLARSLNCSASEVLKNIDSNLNWIKTILTNPIVMEP